MSKNLCNDYLADSRFWADVCVGDVMEILSTLTILPSFERYCTSICMNGSSLSVLYGCIHVECMYNPSARWKVYIQRIILKYGGKYGGHMPLLNLSLNVK